MTPLEQELATICFRIGLSAAQIAMDDNNRARALALVAADLRRANAMFAQMRYPAPVTPKRRT